MRDGVCLFMRDSISLCVVVFVCAWWCLFVSGGVCLCVVVFVRAW